MGAGGIQGRGAVRAADRDYCARCCTHVTWDGRGTVERGNMAASMTERALGAGPVWGHRLGSPK